MPVFSVPGMGFYVLAPGGVMGRGFLTLPLFYFKTNDLLLTFLLQFKNITFYRCFFDLTFLPVLFFMLGYAS